MNLFQRGIAEFGLKVVIVDIYNLNLRDPEPPKRESQPVVNLSILTMYLYDKGIEEQPSP